MAGIPHLKPIQTPLTDKGDGMSPEWFDYFKVQRDALAALLSNLTDAVDDAAAAAANVPVGGFYRTASAVKIRIA